MTMGNVMGYKLVPRRAALFVSAVLGSFEYSLGFLLVVGVWPRIAELVCALFFLSLAAVVAQAVARGLANDCGCFGALQKARTSWVIVVRNLVIGGLMLFSSLSAPDSGKRIAVSASQGGVSVWALLPLLLFVILSFSRNLNQIWRVPLRESP